MSMTTTHYPDNRVKNISQIPGRHPLDLSKHTAGQNFDMKERVNIYFIIWCVLDTSGNDIRGD